MANLVVWADIPVTDMERAKRFYSALLGYPIEDMPGQAGKVALLMPMGTGSQDDVSADITTEGITQPSSTHGAVIYISANGDIDGMLERAVAAGGRIHTEKSDYGESGGWLAWIIDSEGNLVGLQQPSD